MTSEHTQTSEWRVDDTGGEPDRPRALLIGPGHTFAMRSRSEAEPLAALLNAQSAALAEAGQRARDYDCGKTSLQKAAMVPCRNLPANGECYACQLTRARLERNSYCICDDDDEFPTGPADYCPVHGNTYKYVLQEEARLVDAVRARDAAVVRAERLESALREIAGMASATGRECSEAARRALEVSS